MGKLKQILIDIGFAFCLGAILGVLSFIRSLNGYRIVSESMYWFLTVVFYLLLVSCIWNCSRYKSQPLLRFAVILIGFFTATNLGIQFRILLKVCDAYQVDAESNAQGLIGLASILGMLLVGGITVASRMVCVRFKLMKNCIHYFDNGRYQVLCDSHNTPMLYDAAYEEVVTSDIVSYRYKRPYILVHCKEGYVAIDTAFGEILYTDSTEDLPEQLKKKFLIESNNK